MKEKLYHMARCEAAHPVCVSNDATAAAAGGPLFKVARTMPRRARRSSRDSDAAAETARFLERESFVAIAMDDSSEHQVSIVNAES